jgi:hypothetical protein
MSWTNRFGAKATAAAAMLLAVGIVISPTPAEAGVVVSSSGPSAGQYPVGRQIAASDRITLRDGDTVTVLENGGTRVFRGAGNHALNQASTASRSRAFASLTTQRSASRARTGAVRTGAASEVSNPSLWYVDVAAAGTVCLPTATNVRLWRADTQAESTYAIAPEGTSRASSSVTFPAGEMLARWTANQPPVAGTTYRIGHGGSIGPVEVRFVFLDQTPEEPEALASTLIANGCLVQVEQMSSAMLGG